MPYYIRDPKRDHNFDNHPSGVISRVSILITHIRGLITPLITTYEPPSTIGNSCRAPRNRGGCTSESSNGGLRPQAPSRSQNYRPETLNLVFVFVGGGGVVGGGGGGFWSLVKDLGFRGPGFVFELCCSGVSGLGVGVCGFWAA